MKPGVHAAAKARKKSVSEVSLSLNKAMVVHWLSLIVVCHVDARIVGARARLLNQKRTTRRFGVHFLATDVASVAFGVERHGWLRHSTHRIVADVIARQRDASDTHRRHLPRVCVPTMAHLCKDNLHPRAKEGSARILARIRAQRSIEAVDTRLRRKGIFTPVWRTAPIAHEAAAHNVVRSIHDRSKLFWCQDAIAKEKHRW
jgi:hypothetical protein